jgi:hypothetical protein
MATTTPNYGWPVPTSTDFVKDGATAIEALGDAIDATVFGLPTGALTLISTTTIGTAVSSVTVTDAFSADYDNYKIILSDGVGVTQDLKLTLGATVSNYFFVRAFINVSTSATTFQGVSNTSSWANAGAGSGNALSLTAEIISPFLATRTICNSQVTQTTGLTTFGWFNGFLADTTSYTDFTITPSTGTMTGGTIRVYGYQNS